MMLDLQCAGEAAAFVGDCAQAFRRLRRTPRKRGSELRRGIFTMKGETQVRFAFHGKYGGALVAKRNLVSTIAKRSLK